MPKPLPISENEIGVVYKLTYSAFFYPLDCAYYRNILSKNTTGKMPNRVLNQMSFQDFKKLYPIHISSNHYTKSKNKHTYL